MTHDTNETLGALLRLAGERDVPSPAAMERARVVAEAAWRTALQAAPIEPAPRRARMFAWGAAACAVVAVTVGAWYGQARAPVPVARVAAVSDLATLRGPVEGVPAPGANVLSGTMLETTTGRVALSFGVLSLRVDRRSRLRFDAPDQVRLLEGSVYVDSGGVNALAALRIGTPAGAVRHVGTQFQLTVDGGLTRIRVREGRVALDGTTRREVAAGEKLEVVGAQAVLTRGEPSSGDAWDWVSQTAPAFDIENRLLPEFLAWIAREHGWQLRYADAASQARLQQVRLHGSLDGLDAVGMIERVALITGTSMVLREGVLTIGAKP